MPFERTILQTVLSTDMSHRSLGFIAALGFAGCSGSKAPPPVSPDPEEVVVPEETPPAEEAPADDQAALLESFCAPLRQLIESGRDGFFLSVRKEDEPVGGWKDSGPTVQLPGDYKCYFANETSMSSDLHCIVYETDVAEEVEPAFTQVAQVLAMCLPADQWELSQAGNSAWWKKAGEPRVAVRADVSGTSSAPHYQILLLIEGVYQGS